MNQLRVYGQGTIKDDKKKTELKIEISELKIEVKDLKQKLIKKNHEYEHLKKENELYTKLA